MRKIFKGAALLGVLGAGAYGLSATGTMPEQVYTRTLGFTAAIQGGSGPFDGTWVAGATSAIAETDEAFCGTAQGKFVVQGTRMYGSVRNEFGNTFMIRASVDSGGEIAGGMALGTENVASFEGVLLDTDGTGTWEDELGCYGNVSFSRITALGSHDARYIRSLSGRGFVIRGVRTMPALPGTVLREGDVVSVEQGSSITLQLGDKKLSIAENTKFEIAGPAPAPSTASWFGSLMTAAKYLIAGPSFEIKVPTAVAGVRG